MAAVEATQTAIAESTRTAEAAQATATSIAAAQATQTAAAIAQATAQAQRAVDATATAIAVATLTACPDQVIRHVENFNGAYAEFELRASANGTVTSWLDGYNTQYVFPTCRGIGWSNAVFTCQNGTWVGNPQFYSNALCTGNTNNAQRGLTLGVQ